MPAGLPKPVATLARCLLSLMPTEHDSPVSAAITSRICSASSNGPVDVGAQIRLVPAPHLDRMAEIAQQIHHLLGRLVVGVGVQRQKRRVRALAGRGAQRHAGVHTALARRVGRARDDLAGLARVAVAADNDWQAGKFGIAAHFDRSLELVEVDVQHPAGCHAPQSLRATPSQASPSSSSVRPRSVSW